MEGRRWKTVAVASLLATAGCKGFGSKPSLTSGQPTPAAAAVAAAPKSGNALTRMFAPKSGTPPKFQPPEAVAEAPARKGPLKPETVAALANAQVGAAFDFQEEGKPNPNLDRMADEARMKFQKALEADPKNHDALQGLARLYTRLGDRERAVATLQTLLKHHPQDHKAAYELALTHARFEDWAGGVAACQKAIAGDPENRRYQRTLGMLVARTGNFEEGFNTMAAVMPEAEARFTMAKLLTDMEKPDLARQQLDLAAKADPAFVAAQEAMAAAAAAAAANPVQPVEYREEGK
jgi:Flp pilus assembly protein TadD